MYRFNVWSAARQMNVLAYYKASLVGFVAGTLLFALFGLVTGGASAEVVDSRAEVIHSLIAAGVGVLIAVALVAARDASRRRR
jgi:membrane protein DedA with SNARE-associated domain